MSEILKEQVGNLNYKITINLPSEEYLPKVNEALKNYKSKAHLKGFRKGKTPMGYIKKVYGQGVLAEVINEMIQKNISEYIEKENLNILGQPIPAEDNERLELDIQEPRDLSYKFEVGMAPEIEIKGMEEPADFMRYLIDISEETLEKEVTNLRKQMGERESVEGPVEEDDVLYIKVVELEEGEIKPGGIMNDTTILANRLGETAKEKAIGLNKGDQFDAELKDLEINSNIELIEKYILGIEKDQGVDYGNDYRITIDDIVRLKLSEINDDLFEKAFPGGDIKSEEDLREELRKNLQNHFDKRSDSLLFADIQKYFKEANSLELPDEFLKKWLKISNEKLDDEKLEEEYESFSEGLQWNLVRNQLIRDLKIEVTPEEVKNVFKDRVRSYFGPQASEEDLDRTAAMLMQKREQIDEVYEEVMNDKLFASLKEKSSVKDEHISEEEFEKKVSVYQKG